jgi:HK97 family phage portal protein
VFYQLSNDKLAGLENGQIMVPASEIIHDRFNCLFHPLVGMSPIYAAGLAATQGLSIQEDSTLFFKNGARPGGVLTADGAIQDDTAARLKAYWDENFTGSNAGKVAVLGDGLKYEQIRAKANDSQVIEQLKWSAEVVCGVYHVPPFMIGVGAEPTYDNVQTVTLRYYSQCLQVLIKDITDLLDEGLGMDGISIGCDFDTDELLRMDALTQMDVLEKSKGKLTVNEQRRKLNRGPVTGGDTVYLQEQDHSLEWLAKRDAMPIEPAAADPASAPPADNDNDSEIAAQANKAMIAILKGLR